MKNIFFIFLLICYNSLLFAVHNFTINGSDNIQISVGDTLELSFDFEEMGNAATMEIIIYLSSFDFPVLSPENAVFTDGSSLDETPIDGHFLYHFDNFAMLPQTSSVTIKLTDNDVTDEVTIGFQQLSSDFSIAGRILKEGTYVNTAVRGALVYTFYNANKDELNELFENPTTDEFMDYMQEDRYFLSVLSNNSGDYQIFVPDEIENVPCTVDVFSSLDTNDEKVSPQTLDLIVNGNLTGIDLLYQNPDGNFSGTILNAQGDSLNNATIIVRNADSTATIFTFSDSLGYFDIPLLNNTYLCKIIKNGYQIYNEGFAINDSDYAENIILTEEITHLDAPSNLNISKENNCFILSWDTVENAEYYSVYSSENPYAPIILWQTEVDSTTANQWIIANIGDKRFYLVKARR